MVRLKFAWSVLLVAFWVSPCAAATMLITNATLISPERSEPLLDAWVLIEDGVITAIGNGEADVPEAELVDATDRYLIPGLESTRIPGACNTNQPLRHRRMRTTLPHSSGSGPSRFGC